MKSSKVFNNISDKLKAKIPKLKPGEQVVFRMLNGTPNPDPDPTEKEKNPVLYGKLQIRTNMRIYDPYQKDSDGNEIGGYVDIGCVDQWQGENPLTFRFFVPGQGQYSRFQGKFSLQGGNAKDEELYEILWLSPERKGSPCEDSSIEPMFEIIDLKADSKASVTRFDTLKKAINIATQLEEDEKQAAAIMAALNQPSYQDKSVLMAKLKELARDKPDDFIATYESNETPVIGVLREALDRGIINHDISTGEVKMGSVAIQTFKVADTAMFIPEFAKWITTAANGNDVLNNIKSRLEKKTVK